MDYLGLFLVWYFILNFGAFLLAPKTSKIYKYSLKVCLGYDQLVNTFIDGDPDETISSRAYKGRLRGSKGWTLLANFLDWLDPNHTEEAVEWDEGTGKPADPLIGLRSDNKEE